MSSTDRDGASSGDDEDVVKTSFDGLHSEHDLTPSYARDGGKGRSDTLGPETEVSPRRVRRWSPPVWLQIAALLATIIGGIIAAIELAVLLL